MSQSEVYFKRTPPPPWLKGVSAPMYDTIYWCLKQMDYGLWILSVFQIHKLAVLQLKSNP